MQDKKVAKLFEEQLKYYSQTNSSSSTSPLVDLFYCWVKNKKNDKKLDVAEFGGAAGQLLSAINSKYPNVNLTNIELVTKYQKKQVLKKIKFINRSILHSGLEKKSFDCIIVRDVLHHLIGKNLVDTRENQIIALKELKRLVRPGGIILIEELVNQSKIAARIIYWLSMLNSKIGFKSQSFQVSPYTIIALLTSQELLKMAKEIFGSKNIIKDKYRPDIKKWPAKVIHLGCSSGKFILFLSGNATV